MAARAPSTPAAPARAGLLRYRDVRLLLAGQAVSELGSQVGSIALPLVAVLGLGASPLQIGMLTAAGTVSFAVLALPARPRRPGRAGQGQRLPGVVPVGHPARRSRPGRLAGAARRRPMAVLTDAASFLVSAWCLLAIRAREPRPARPARPALRRELAEGLRFVLGRPELRAITACTALTNLLWAAAGTVQLLFLVHQVGLAPAAIGLLFSAGAAGGLLAALAATRAARCLDAARLIWVPVTVTAPFALCTPLTAPGWRLALLPIGVAVTSFGQALYNIGQISFRQALCPPELLGRMNASIRFLVFGALPLGGLLGGLAGERLGVHATLWLCGIGLALTPVPLLASPLRRPRPAP